jgi:hypothetical protein
MSTYEDLKINTFLGEASVYEVWPAKPPANLTFAALTPVPVVCYATEGIASNLMDIKDQAYLLRAGIFCDFADGIIKMNDGIFTLRVGAGESTVTPVFSLGSRDYRIPALNTMFEINETIGNLTTKRIAEIGGATNYVIQPIRRELHTPFYPRSRSTPLWLILAAELRAKHFLEWT